MTFAPKSSPKSNFAKLALVVILVATAAIIFYFNMQNKPWIVPDEAKRVQNPIAPSDSALASGRAAYLDKCAECHGDSGKGDGSQAKQYSPGPSNLTDTPHLNTETDGELFYKITHGHKPMPAFEKRLTDEQRWQVVLWIRQISHSVSPASPSAH